MKRYQSEANSSLNNNKSFMAKSLMVGAMLNNNIRHSQENPNPGKQDRSEEKKTGKEIKVFQQNPEHVLSFLSKNPALADKITKQITEEKKKEESVVSEVKKAPDNDDLAEEMWKNKIEERTLLDVQVSITKELKNLKERKLVIHEPVIGSLERELQDVDRNLKSIRKITTDLDEQIDFTRVGQEMKKLIS
ncbi:MAG: hypothetical protein OEZ36_09325, partial [Spirochaetota bacterium]|nr:hypothetical protein [Spirochaetota bacterium]